MSHYIKRTDALRIVDLHYGPRSGYNEIKRLPAEDVVLVVHGRWIHATTEDNDWGGTYHHYTCSNCDFHGDSIFGEANYCPNCGARMDGEVE